MSNYNSLKATIDANIKQNGNQEITGQILNSVLNQMVTTLGAGYQFAGVATIATNPGSPDAKVFYIANGKGTYEKFGGINVTEDDVVVLYWDSSWHKVATGIASQAKLSELEGKINTATTKVNNVVANDAAQERTINGLKDQVNNYKPIVIDGNVTNAADEEDLTSENGLLKIKNRSSLNGMGYVILRKNKPIQSQLVVDNAIYEVKYDFILNERVILPKNAIIRFDGGKFIGGTLLMDNTDFDNLSDNVFDGVHFEGTTKTKIIKASYFSIHPSIKENIVNLQPYLDCLSEFVSCMTNGVHLSFENGCYGFGGESKTANKLYLGNHEYALYRNYALYVNTSSKDVVIDGKGATFINMINNHYGCWDTSSDSFIAYESATNVNDSAAYHTMGGGIVYFFSRKDKDFVRISNIAGNYNQEKILGGNTFISSTQSGFEVGDNVKFLSIKNCQISNNITDAINITGQCDSIEIDGCNLSNSGRSNLSVADTKVNVSITNSQFVNSGDWDRNLDFRWEGVGAAINLEPFREQSGKAEISNCLFDGYAYTAITMGATLNNSFDIVSIKGCQFQNNKMGRTISNNKVTTLNSLASCCVGRVNQEVSISDSTLVNTAIALEKFQQTSRETLSFEYVRLNRLMLLVSSEFYGENGRNKVFSTSFYQLQPRRKIIADNIYICSDNGASVDLLVDNTIAGVKERDNSIFIDNVYCLLNDHNTYGEINASSQIIENAYIVNFEKLTASYGKTDYGISKACKNIYYIDAAKSGFVPFMINSTRDINHAPMKNVGKLASNTIDVNFINLSNDSWRTILFGCSANQNTISFLPKNSVIIRDPSSLQGEQLGTLFSVINNDSNLSTGTEKYFYGVRKGLPFGATDISSISGYVPELGEMCFDKVSKKPYWWNGSNWVDASGNIKTL